MNYYNEIEPYPAAWLRNLIKEGLIPDGEVDTRSIVDVRPADLVGFEQCHFFAGLGGWCRALRVAGFPDDRPVWTGSCPCQPFSSAGKQKGFADERHLWPVWRELIRERRPSKVYGEQVASAAQWLRLVRGDLEAMEYAVGCMPIEAASAGADHLRDRYWFVGEPVANTTNSGRENRVNRLGESSGAPQSGRCQQADGPSRPNPAFGGSIDVGHRHRSRLAIGSFTEVERGNVRHEGPPVSETGDRSDDLADSDQQRAGSGRLQRGRQFGRSSSDSETRDRSDVGYADVGRWEAGRHDPAAGHRDSTATDGAPPFEWVVGADGKARRVKPGVRLLVDGVPDRVAKLRALGNAIDPRPAAAFIRATM